MPRRSPVSSDKRFKTTTHIIDWGTPERARHSCIVTERLERGGAEVARVAAECMLDQLRDVGQVTPAMHRAGIRLRADYQRGKVAPRQVMQYAPGVRGTGWNGGFERSEKEELAYKDWRIALQVVGVGLSEALVSICCLDLAPQQRQRAMKERLFVIVQYLRFQFLPAEARAAIAFFEHSKRTFGQVLRILISAATRDADVGAFHKRFEEGSRARGGGGNNPRLMAEP